MTEASLLDWIKRQPATLGLGDDCYILAGSAEDLVFTAETAGGAGAEMIVTTEKDYVRLLPLEPWPLPIDFVPIDLRPEPFDEFRTWIASELMAIRGQAGG